MAELTPNENLVYDFFATVSTGDPKVAVQRTFASATRARTWTPRTS